MATHQDGKITVRTTPTSKTFTVRLHGGMSAALGGAVTETILTP
jgi:hypothetical protein